jgi:hypothetical protein
MPATPRNLLCGHTSAQTLAELAQPETETVDTLYSQNGLQAVRLVLRLCNDPAASFSTPWERLTSEYNSSSDDHCFSHVLNHPNEDSNISEPRRA